MTAITRQPRQQTCPHKRRLAGTRSAKDHTNPWRRRFTEAAQLVQRLHDRGIAAKKYPGVFRLERPKTAIGRAIWIILRTPGKVFRVKPGELQSVL